MDILLNIRLKLGTEGRLCCELSQIRPAILRKDNSFKPLPIRKLAEILALLTIIHELSSQGHRWLLRNFKLYYQAGS